jgi:hypothetical protein
MNIKLLCYIGCILLICLIISIKIDNNKSSNLSITVKENFIADNNNSTIIDNRLVKMNDQLSKLELKLSVLKEPVNNTILINKSNIKKPYVASVKHYYG